VTQGVFDAQHLLESRVFVALFIIHFRFALYPARFIKETGGRIGQLE